jgi:catechol 2,3-dioxygenase-like lactoylglutathione lyase family enzyme
LGLALIATREAIVIDHMGFPISDYARAKPFYERVLATLGYKLVMEVGKNEFGAPAAGFGPEGNPVFWIGGEGGLNRQLHIAFVAQDRASVDAFHKAALEGGATDNGGPGLRPHYGANYYAAFALDHDGHNIEAVCQKPA